jgi:hypothetical protein
MRKEAAAANRYCQFIAVARPTDAAQTGTEQFRKNSIISWIAHPFALNRYRQIAAVLSIAL